MLQGKSGGFATGFFWANIPCVLQTLSVFTPETVFIEYLCFLKLFINFYIEAFSPIKCIYASLSSTDICSC